MRRRLITAETQRRELLVTYGGMAALLGLPIAASILVATALALHLPAAFPWRDGIVDLSRSIAVIIALGAYFGATWSMATSYFYSEYPLDIVGPGIVMTTTGLLPVACLFIGLLWAGVPIDRGADDMVLRLRWFFAVLPSFQILVWVSASVLGRLF